ncbi:MAG: hypothetical protein AAFZ06_15320, partial [Pseudomonadota bacterium]
MWLDKNLTNVVGLPASALEEKAEAGCIADDWAEKPVKSNASDAVRLSLEGLRHAYGATPAIHDVSLEVHAGEVVSLLGPSG